MCNLTKICKFDLIFLKKRRKFMIRIILVEPEIPQNAGNIMRTCAATGCELYLVKPLGFTLDDKHYKRAGLDYFEYSTVRVVENFSEIQEKFKGIPFFFASTKAPRSHTDATFPADCCIVFGKESYGLSETILEKNYDHCIRIPMKKETRSLNLATSVGIILFEALRQNNFPSLSDAGELTGRVEKD